MEKIFSLMNNWNNRKTTSHRIALFMYIIQHYFYNMPYVPRDSAVVAKVECPCSEILPTSLSKQCHSN